MEQAGFKPIIDHILEGLNDQFGDAYTYFWGDPMEIGASSYPAICIVPGITTITQEMTGVDTVNREILVEVIFSKLPDFGASPNQDLTERKLDNATLARQADGTWDPNSIVSFLRFNITLDNTTVSQEVKIQPITAVRPTERGEGKPTVTSESHITISVQELVPQGSRI